MDVNLCFTEIHKINENIPIKIHDDLPEHVPIQKWNNKRPQPSTNHTRVPKSILKQYKDQIWIICTSLYRHH